MRCVCAVAQSFAVIFSNFALSGVWAGNGTCGYDWIQIFQRIVEKLCQRCVGTIAAHAGRPKGQKKALPQGGSLSVGKTKQGRSNKQPCFVCDSVPVYVSIHGAGIGAHQKRERLSRLTRTSYHAAGHMSMAITGNRRYRGHRFFPQCSGGLQWSPRSGPRSTAGCSGGGRRKS